MVQERKEPMSPPQNNNNDFIAISIGNPSYPPSSKLFCNLCSCNLILLDAEKEEWFCTRCNISYYPAKEKVKRPNKFMTPGPEIDQHGNIIGDKTPLLSIVDNDREPSSSYSKPKLPKSFQEMERHGVKITSYSTSEDR
jgi:hypothetical protein